MLRLDGPVGVAKGVAQVQTLNTQYAIRTSHSPAGLASPSETDPH